MFMVRKDLPLSGLNDVTTMTFNLGSLTVMNSKFVRNTRNASLMILRLPSLTTTVLISCIFLLKSFFLFLVESGISPIKGIDNISKSLRPRMVEFMFSIIKIATTGMSIPRAKASSNMFFRTGVVGAMLPVGGVIMRVL